MQRAVVAIRNRILADEGEDLVEYGVLMALIAIVAIGAVTTLGQTIENVFWQAIAAKF